MTTAKKVVKQKPLTKLQELEHKVSILESAIYQGYNDYDEIQSMIRMLRDYSQSEQFNKYWLKDFCNAMLTNSICNQTNMMDYAGLEY
jgi:hypothetical protein